MDVELMIDDTRPTNTSCQSLAIGLEKAGSRLGLPLDDGAEVGGVSPVINKLYFQRCL